MSNPWLGVPLEDYEGHMNSPQVWQLEALSDLFAEALALCRPASVAILGVAGGNGLDRIDRAVTKRVVGVDIHPAYLEAVSQRYPGVELHCADLAKESLSLEPVEMVHAALIFEHAGADVCLENALAQVAPGGFLSVVLQLPSDSQPGVGTSEIPTVQCLASHFSLVDDAGLRDRVEHCEFRLIDETRRALPGGKGFWMGIFERCISAEIQLSQP